MSDAGVEVLTKLDADLRQLFESNEDKKDQKDRLKICRSVFCILELNVATKALTWKRLSEKSPECSILRHCSVGFIFLPFYDLRI